MIIRSTSLFLAISIGSVYTSKLNNLIAIVVKNRRDAVVLGTNP